MILLWQNSRLPRRQSMRVALLGGGTIARLVLQHVRGGEFPGVEIVAVAGRNGSSRGSALAREFGVSYVAGRAALVAARPAAVVEAASHAAEDAARRSGALLYVPSGGIGGLDALKAACAAGVDEVSIQVAKPPLAWKGIPYVAALGVDLDRLQSAHILFEGPAREGVPHFPANVNIAAVLSLAGIGWDRTRLKVVADPGLELNTHTIRVSGRSGRFTVVLENVPAPENPKTSWLACYSVLAALKSIESPVRYGT